MMRHATKAEEKIGFSTPGVANQSGYAGQGIGEEVFAAPAERRAMQVR